MTTAAQSPLAVLQAFLADALDPDKVEAAAERLVAPDATYVSLNFDNPELNRVMPWAGTKQGRAAFVRNFLDVHTQWDLEEFTPLDTLEDGDRAVVFGRFTLRSKTLRRAATSPMAVLARVRDGQITYFQYMEDTFATARTFRRLGTWTIEAVPGARSFEV